MNDQMTPATRANESAVADDSIGARIKIDYAEIIAATPLDLLSERAAFDSDDYETDEEVDAALEAFFNEIIEGPHEAD